MGTVTTASMQLTIDEEGYTRVNELYQVSAPINGRMLRVKHESGDLVVKGQTIIARMLPNLLNVKESQQAKANVQIAKATVDAAKATLKRVESEFVLAKQRATRASNQVKVGAISVDENDLFQQEVQSKSAELTASKSMLNVHISELDSAQAALAGSVADNNGTNDPQSKLEIVNVFAPISGKVLTISQKNESVLTAGTPILTIGNVKNDLEIVIEMLSSDAVQVQKGQQVLLRNWMGSKTGHGTIVRVEPNGFIKTSSLGVEERRVNVIVKPNNPEKIPLNMGHGFRVDASIIVWQRENVIAVPVSAMFREQGQWKVFVVENNKILLKQIEIEQNNGTIASVMKGLESGDTVVLYPSAELTTETEVANR